MLSFHWRSSNIFPQFLCNLLCILIDFSNAFFGIISIFSSDLQFSSLFLWNFEIVIRAPFWFVKMSSSHFCPFAGKLQIFVNLANFTLRSTGTMISIIYKSYVHLLTMNNSDRLVEGLVWISNTIRFYFFDIFFSTVVVMLLFLF